MWAVVKAVRTYFQEKHAVPDDPKQLKKWCDGDGTTGIVYVRQSSTGKVKKAAIKDASDNLTVAEGAPIWDGLDFEKIVQDANQE